MIYSQKKLFNDKKIKSIVLAILIFSAGLTFYLSKKASSLEEDFSKIKKEACSFLEQRRDRIIFSVDSIKSFYSEDESIAHKQIILLISKEINSMIISSNLQEKFKELEVSYDDPSFLSLVIEQCFSGDRRFKPITQILITSVVVKKLSKEMLDEIDELIYNIDESTHNRLIKKIQRINNLELSDKSLERLSDEAKSVIEMQGDSLRLQIERIINETWTSIISIEFAKFHRRIFELEDKVASFWYLNIFWTIIGAIISIVLETVFSAIMKKLNNLGDKYG